MKETFERKPDLPPFRIDLADLEVLCEKIRKQFPEKHDLDIYLKIGTRSLHAYSLKELRTAPELPKTVYHFYIRLHSWEPPRNCTIYAYQQQFGHPWVLVEGDDETWCAGMVDLVQTFTRNHRRWYSTLRGWPLLTVAFFSPAVLGILEWTGTISKSAYLASMAPWGMFLFLWFARPYLLPAGTLVIRREDSFWKRHVLELTLWVTIISLVVMSAQFVITLKSEPISLQNPQAQPITPVPADAVRPPSKAPASESAS